MLVLGGGSSSDDSLECVTRRITQRIAVQISATGQEVLTTANCCLIQPSSGTLMVRIS